MNAQTYRLKTKHREFVLTVTELTDRIDVTMTVTKYGLFDDVAELLQWFASIVSKYEDDPRPLAMTDPHTGDQGFVFDGFAVIAPPKKGTT